MMKAVAVLLLALAGSAVAGTAAGPGALIKYCLVNPTQANCTLAARLPIARTRVFLTGPEGQPGTPDAAIPKVCRWKQTNLGDGVADAMLMAAPRLIPRALAHLPVVAMVNGGAIRASVPVGPITVNMTHNISPFGDPLVVKRVNATTLLAALAHGVSTWGANLTDPSGAFPQVAALRYIFSASSKAILAAQIEDRRWSAPLVLAGPPGARLYRGEALVVLNSYMAGGGNGYAMLAAAPNATAPGANIIDSWALADYFAATSPVTLRVNPLSPRIKTVA